MANGFIDMVVVGNAGGDPEMRYTPNGTAVTNFSLAINVRVPRDGERVVETIWVRVTCWGCMAETANQYIKKGDRVLVGSDPLAFDPATGGPVIFTRSNGSTGASFEITARDIRFLGGNGGGNNPRPSRSRLKKPSTSHNPNFVQAKPPLSGGGFFIFRRSDERTL